VQNHGFGSAQRNEVFSQSANKLFGVFDKIFGEAVNSKVDGRQIFNVWVVSENTDVSSGSKRGKLIDEFDVISLQENKICSEFKR